MIKDVQRTYHRRTILSLLLYDADYRLSVDMLELVLDAAGHNLTRDQIETEAAWLEEQGYVTRERPARGLVVVTLTDRGLEIARGKVRVPGIRDLRPSEIHEMQGR